MTKLDDGLRELAAELAKKPFTEDLLLEIAEDNELNPKLLERKFKEKFNVEPAQFKPLVKRPEMTEQRLLKLAHEMWKENRLIGEPSPDLFGKRFSFDGQEYMAVAYIPGNILLCVNAENGKKMQIKWKRQVGIHKFLTKWF